MRFHQNGNAVIFILLAVGLFGALAFTFMRGSQQSQGNMNEQQAKIIAQEILNYSASVQKAVDKLRSRGCSENQISFENTLQPTGLINPNAPGTFECHVFKSEGAGLQPYNVPVSWFAPYGQDYFWYTGSESYTGIGTTCTNASCGDLAINIWSINMQVCEQINNMLGYSFSSIPTDTSHCWDGYEGAFSCSGGAVFVRFSGVDLQGKEAVCFRDATDGYTFNRILIAR